MLLRIGNSKRTYRIEFVSNSPIEKKEYERCAAALACEAIPSLVGKFGSATHGVPASRSWAAPVVSWIATLRHENADVPTVSEMNAKVDMLRVVRTHEVTDAEIDYMLTEKKKVPWASLSSGLAFTCATSPR